MNNELKPACPFCGSIDTEEITTRDMDERMFKCNDCGTTEYLSRWEMPHRRSFGWIKIDPNDPNTFPPKGCSSWLWVAINYWTTIAQYACGVFKDIHGVTFKKQPAYWMMLPSIPPED